MSGPFVLALRLLLVISLYAFLGYLLFTLWWDVRRQGDTLAARGNPRIAVKLLTSQGQPDTRHFALAEITLGRDPACEVPVADPAVSARHARLTYHHSQWWLEDLGSKNGTRLNDLEVAIPTVLVSGDEITFGQTRLVVELNPSATGFAVFHPDTTR